jgi:hypothetical protein
VLGGDLQGFPNGRRLTDDVVDIEVQALEGAAQTGKIVKALAAGDGVNSNDRSFGTSFPYVALPNVGAVNTGGTAAGAASTGKSAAAAPAGGGSPPAERSISAASAASSAGGNTLATVIIATTGTAAVALAGVLITGWLMRRRRSSAAGTGAGGPADPQVQA